MKYMKVLSWGVLCLVGCKSGVCLTDTDAQMQLSLVGSTCPLVISIPETDASVLLNGTARRGDDWLVKGCYSIAHAPDVVERGTVWLNCTSVASISRVNTGPPADTLYFAAVFIVSNQGSGVFHYIGLFERDPKTQRCSHMDSYLLGDRVTQIHIEDLGRAVKVNYLTHAAGQSFDEEPTEAASVNLYVEDNLSWRLYEGMHPSWDRNHDGINDCEDDGTCDDTQDYTRAREN